MKEIKEIIILLFVIIVENYLMQNFGLKICGKKPRIPCVLVTAVIAGIGGTFFKLSFTVPWLVLLASAFLLAILIHWVCKEKWHISITATLIGMSIYFICESIIVSIFLYVMKIDPIALSTSPGPRIGLTIGTWSLFSFCIFLIHKLKFTIFPENF